MQLPSRRSVVAKKTAAAPSSAARMAMISLRLFVLGLVFIVVPLVWFWFKVRSPGGNTGDVLLLFIVLMVASVATSAAWLVSAVCGLCTVREKPYVLWWVVPESIILLTAATRWLFRI